MLHFQIFFEYDGPIALRIFWSISHLYVSIIKKYSQYSSHNTTKKKSCHSNLFSITTTKDEKGKNCESDLINTINYYEQMCNTLWCFITNRLLNLRVHISFSWFQEFFLLFFYYCDKNKFLSLKTGWNYIFRSKFNMICRKAKWKKKWKINSKTDKSVFYGIYSKFQIICWLKM